MEAVQAENITLGIGDEKFKISEITKKINEITSRYGFHLDPAKKIHEMSVSEKQTVEIIKVLYRGADILILDEPFKGLDTDNKIAVMEYVKKKTSDKTVLLITHDLSEAEFFDSEIINLFR